MEMSNVVSVIAVERLHMGKILKEQRYARASWTIAPEDSPKAFLHEHQPLILVLRE